MKDLALNRRCGKSYQIVKSAIKLLNQKKNAVVICGCRTEAQSLEEIASHLGHGKRLRILIANVEQHKGLLGAHDTTVFFDNIENILCRIAGPSNKIEAFSYTKEADNA